MSITKHKILNKSKVVSTCWRVPTIGSKVNFTRKCELFAILNALIGSNKHGEQNLMYIDDTGSWLQKMSQEHLQRRFNYVKQIKSYRKCFPNSFISHALLITWHKCPAHSAQTQSVSTFCMVSRLNSSCLIELSSKSTWLLIGNWLFCMQDLPYSVGFWCMLGGKYFQ